MCFVETINEIARNKPTIYFTQNLWQNSYVRNSTLVMWSMTNSLFTDTYSTSEQGNKSLILYYFSISGTEG